MSSASVPKEAAWAHEAATVAASSAITGRAIDPSDVVIG
jgi:hypothetical protein